VNVGLSKRFPAGKFAMWEGREEGSAWLCGKSGNGEPLIEELFQRVMAGEFGNLAALFVESNPTSPLLDIVIFHLQADDGTDPGEGVAHDSDQGAIAASY